MRVLVLFTALISFSANAADLFDLPASKTWTKVQDGEVIQWAVVIPNTEQPTRVDLVSSIEEGKRQTFYSLRKRCPSGKNAVSFIKAGNAAGPGRNCRGVNGVHYMTELSAHLEKVDALPEDAAKLIRPAVEAR